MTTTIYHNPQCGTSRNTLALIRNAGIEPKVVEYLVHPPSRETLTGLIARAGMTVREALREKGTPYAELGLDDPMLSDDQLIDAMLAHPILINRPFVETELGVRLCRPSDEGGRRSRYRRDGKAGALTPVRTAQARRAGRYRALLFSQRCCTCVGYRPLDCIAWSLTRTAGARRSDMNKKILGAVLGVAVLAASSAASAHVDLAVGIGVPGYYAAPQPVYVAPPPPVAVAYGYGYDDGGWRAREWRERRERHWRHEARREERWRERHGWD
jgi:arsenate reductase